MNIIPGKDYTLEELREIAGDSYMSYLSSSFTSNIPSPSKSVVYTYNDFDNKTKLVYREIYNLLSSINTDSFLLFAVGCRVNGQWRTSEEVQEINSEYNLQLENSPYEYYTDAKIIPTSTQLATISSDSLIRGNITAKTHLVIIPPNE